MYLGVKEKKLDNQNNYLNFYGYLVIQKMIASLELCGDNLLLTRD